MHTPQKWVKSHPGPGSSRTGVARHRAQGNAVHYDITLNSVWTIYDGQYIKARYSTCYYSEPLIAYYR